MNWGIIGAGAIAHQFADDLKLVGHSTLYGIASRQIDKAMAFKEYHDVHVAYGSYDELLQDSAIDIVYIATPHHSHCTLIIDALDAGKHVLCEKPIAVHTAELMQIIVRARQKDLFVMEALWTRFNPAMIKMLHLIEAGGIGEINHIQADFSFRVEASDDERLLNPHLAGGSLLDIGVYPLFLVYVLWGMPQSISAEARFYKTGVDLQTAAILKYENGFAQVMSSFVSDSDMTARIYGSKGTIVIQAPWYKTQGFEVHSNGKIKAFNVELEGRGYTYEILECENCIGQGLVESPLWTLHNSMDLTRLTESIRIKIGLKYPFEG